MPVQKVTTLDPIRTSVKQTNYSKTNVKRIGATLAEIQGIYPFKVRFTDIGYPGISGNNAPGIGIAIIGFNNYIL
jgi:hypothetical protein